MASLVSCSTLTFLLIPLSYFSFFNTSHNYLHIFLYFLLLLATSSFLSPIPLFSTSLYILSLAYCQSLRWWTLTILFFLFFSYLLFYFYFWGLRVRVNITSLSHCHMSHVTWKSVECSERMISYSIFNTC